MSLRQCGVNARVRETRALRFESAKRYGILRLLLLTRTHVHDVAFY